MAQRDELPEVRRQLLDRPRDRLSPLEVAKLAVGIDAAADRNRLQGVLEVVTFLGPFVRLEVTVHGRPFWVDVPTERATALERRKPLTLAFAPTDCVVLPEGTPAVP